MDFKETFLFMYRTLNSMMLQVAYDILCIIFVGKCSGLDGKYFGCVKDIGYKNEYQQQGNIFRADDFHRSIQNILYQTKVIINYVFSNFLCCFLLQHFKKNLQDTLFSTIGDS
jgi:hypothetical protein